MSVAKRSSFSILVFFLFFLFFVASRRRFMGGRKRTEHPLVTSIERLACWFCFAFFLCLKCATNPIFLCNKGLFPRKEKNTSTQSPSQPPLFQRKYPFRFPCSPQENLSHTRTWLLLGRATTHTNFNSLAFFLRAAKQMFDSYWASWSFVFPLHSFVCWRKEAAVSISRSFFFFFSFFLSPCLSPPKLHPTNFTHLVLNQAEWIPNLKIPQTDRFWGELKLLGEN